MRDFTTKIYFCAYSAIRAFNMHNFKSVTYFCKDIFPF